MTPTKEENTMDTKRGSKKRVLPEILWADPDGTCRIMFFPDNRNKLFLEFGEQSAIIFVRVALGSSFVDFLNSWHEYKKEQQ